MVKKRVNRVRYFLLPVASILVVLLIIGVFSGALFKDYVRYSGSGTISNLDLTLSKDKFGDNENLKGNLKIEHNGELDLDEDVKFDVLDCGSYSEKIFTLFQVLNGSGLVDEELSSFTRDTSSNSYLVTNDKLVGFYFEGTPNNVKFNINGSANYLRLDFGADNTVDWAFSGERTGWDTEIKPSTSCNDYSGALEYDPHPGATQNLVFNYTGNSNEIELRVNAVAKSVGVNSGNLTIKVNNQVCSLSGITSSYKTLSNCEFKIPVVNGENTVQIRFSTTDSNYRIPRCVGETYYFATGNLGLYNTQIIPGSSYLINSTYLAGLINSHKTCQNNACFSVAKIIANSGDSLTFNNLVLTTSTGVLNGFWSVNNEVNQIDVNENNISIDHLSLGTPNVDTNCELQVRIMDEEATDKFDVLKSPDSVITLDSEFATTSQVISFSGDKSTAPSGRTINNYKWYFGDNSTGAGKNATHVYSREGTYKIMLEITDSLGIKDTSEKQIVVGNLETYLENSFSETLDLIENSDLSGLSSESNDVLNGLNLKSNLNSYQDQIETLQSNFTDVKNSDLTSKQVRYAQIATQLKDIKTKYPISATTISKSGSVGFFMDSYEKIFDYKTSGISNLKEYKSKIYDYNLNEVNFDNRYALVKVDFLDGDKTYLLVKKKINAPSNDNKYVEDISEFSGKNITKLTDFNMEGDYITKDFSSDVDINYIVESSNLIETDSVVYKDVELTKPILEENCNSGNCDYAYCGDSVCNTGYEDENSCEQDCKPHRPDWLFYLLGGILLVGIIYIWLYKGPGNFRDISNAISIKLTGKRVFTNKQDLSKLESYVNEMLKKGFTERQLELALKQKGWKGEQIEFVFKRVNR